MAPRQKTPPTVRPVFPPELPCPRCQLLLHEPTSRCPACSTPLWFEQHGHGVILHALLPMAEGHCCESCGRSIPGAGGWCSLCRRASKAIDENARAIAVSEHLGTRHATCECGYDLCGIPGNRCPECNQRYTVLSLERGPEELNQRRVPGVIVLLILGALFGIQALVCTGLVW